MLSSSLQLGHGLSIPHFKNSTLRTVTEVKWKCKAVPVHAMKAYRCSGDSLYSFLSSAQEGDEWSTLGSGIGKELLHPLNRRLCRVMSLSGRSWIYKNLFVLPEFEPRFVQTVPYLTYWLHFTGYEYSWKSSAAGKRLQVVLVRDAYEHGEGGVSLWGSWLIPWLCNSEGISSQAICSMEIVKSLQPVS